MSQTAIPALTAYLSRLLSMPEVRDTVNFDHIKQGYALTRAGSSRSGHWAKWMVFEAHGFKIFFNARRGDTPAEALSLRCHPD